MTDKELFVQIRHVGFVFEVARRIPCNRIHPALVAFFKPCEPSQHTPFGMEYTHHDSPFRYAGRMVGVDANHKSLVRKAYYLTFSYEGTPFTLPFLLDKTLTSPGQLSHHAYLTIKNRLCQLKPPI